ncbi:MAG: GyrI-like domain-containing protein [Cellvibrionaceae bacterium]
MATTIHSRYLDAVNRIGQYVYDHSDKAITLDELSHLVAISKYHLNRIFAAATGYQLGEFVQRRKLDKAFFLLQQAYEKNSAAAQSEPVKMIDIALAVGYDSHSAFSRAFQKHFSLTPTDIASGKRLASSGQRKLPKYTMPEDEQQNLQPEILTLPQRTIYGFYGKGFTDQSYQAMAEGLYEKLVTLADQPYEQLQPIGVSLDNPWTGDQSQSRFFAGLGLGLEAHCEHLESYTWPAGTWAKFTHVGPYSTMWQTIMKIYAQWAIPNNIVLMDTAMVQRYFHDVYTTPPEELVSELYFGIENT